MTKQQIEACNKFKSDLKEVFGLDVEVMPTINPDGDSIGFTMFTLGIKSNPEGEISPEKIVIFQMPLGKE